MISETYLQNGIYTYSMLPKEVISSVIGNLTLAEKGSAATVCKLWHAAFNDHCKETVIKIYSSISHLLLHPKTLPLHCLFENNERFVPKINICQNTSISQLINDYVRNNFKPFNSGKSITAIMQELATRHGSLSVHIWKAWPPYSFTIITKIFIKNLREQIDSKNCPISLSMSYIHPKDVQSITGQVYPLAPTEETSPPSRYPLSNFTSKSIGNFYVQASVSFWPNNLDPQLSQKILFNLTDGHSLGVEQIEKKCKEFNL